MRFNTYEVVVVMGPGPNGIYFAQIHAFFGSELYECRDLKPKGKEHLLWYEFADDMEKVTYEA